MAKCKWPEKRKHPNKQAALEHIRQLYRQGKGNPDYAPYQCGDHWHIGHSKKWLGQRIKNAVRAGSGKAAKARRIRSRR